MKNILVTGGAGYIGSHAVVELLDSGYEVVVFDNLERGHRELVDERAKFFKGDLRNIADLEELFSTHKIDAVMNFAAYISVPESVSNPIMYYENNTSGVLNLIKVMKKHKVNNIVFSSTAAVYGEVGDELVAEDYPVNPINPYGMSKLMSERIITDSHKAWGLNYSIFRYFNVAGAHEKYKIGQWMDNYTALVPLIIETAIGNREKLKFFGDDFDTKDGTGVRDFIHVVDLVKAHILALEKLKENVSDIYNLGNGNGFSVKEMHEKACKVTNTEIPFEVVERRAGDPASVVASSEKAISELNWKPIYSEVEDIIRTAYDWHKFLQNR